jgi:hypothetical protein
MDAPNGPEQLQITPSLIGAAVTGADVTGAAVVALVDWLLDVGLVAAGLVLEEQAAIAAAIASALTPHRTLRPGIT